MNDLIEQGKIDETVFPIIRGESIPVRLSHLAYLRELLEEGKVEQVKQLLTNLLQKHDI